VRPVCVFFLSSASRREGCTRFVCVADVSDSCWNTGGAFGTLPRSAHKAPGGLVVHWSDLCLNLQESIVRFGLWPLACFVLTVAPLSSLCAKELCVVVVLVFWRCLVRISDKIVYSLFWYSWLSRLYALMLPVCFLAGSSKFILRHVLASLELENEGNFVVRCCTCFH
jgi:hypothetical protein